MSTSGQYGTEPASPAKQSKGVEPAIDSGSVVLTTSTVIMQPTTLCNLDCSYCYLPLRRESLRMPVAVAAHVAATTHVWAKSRPVEICWHGGEPLAAGREHLAALMDAFTEPGTQVTHSIQTNATLIDKAWCDFLADRDVRVGVSIDGHPGDNAARVDLAGRQAFDRILRGIELLIAAGREVSVIAVVGDPSPQRARRLHEFAVELGCTWLGVNIEEREGVNDQRPTNHDLNHTTEFWTELLCRWQHNPSVQVREIDRALGFAARTLREQPFQSRPAMIDPLPTVAFDGAVTLISPELAGFTSERHGTFSCGNVLDEPLDQLIDRGMAANWVREYRRGLRNCRDLCQYYDFCGGGHASNRHFEHGRLDTTETAYCQNSKIALMEGVIGVAHHNTTRHHPR